MQNLGKIFYDALQASDELMEAVGGRIRSTCFEVPPTDQDNTPLPYIIITDDGMSASETTKDGGWMPLVFRVQAGVEIGASSPNEVWDLEQKVMAVIASFVESTGEGDVPELLDGYPQTDGIAWDWTKPCYFDTIRYQCDVNYNH